MDHSKRITRVCIDVGCSALGVFKCLVSAIDSAACAEKLDGDPTIACWVTTAKPVWLLPVLFLDAEPFTNNSRSAFGRGVSERSTLGKHSSPRICTQSWKVSVLSPSFCVGRREAGFRLEQRFTVTLGIFNNVVWHLNHRCADKWDVFCVCRMWAKACGTMRSEYPTKSLEAVTAFSAAATALRQRGRPAATGSSFVEEKKATGLRLSPCFWHRTEVAYPPLWSTNWTNGLFGFGKPRVFSILRFNSTKAFVASGVQVILHRAVNCLPWPVLNS